MNGSPTDAAGAPGSHLSPYGFGGDYIGARRSRRAFRLMVLACLGITASLYFSEHYLRYGLSEVQYRMAMTLEVDSKRAILRNVVKRDQRESEAPTAKYVAALAAIEEEDLVLERFSEALALAPDDVDLLVLYGCTLFEKGDFKEARRVFRDAGLKASKNALPDYLHAAAIAATSSSEEDFRTAVAMVARTNDSGEPLRFPEPFWHESLPREGYWYADLRKNLTDRVCAPLYTLKNIVVKRVRDEMQDGSPLALDSWLYQLQILGDHLVGEQSDPADTRTTSVVIAGLNLQQEAVQLRQQLLAGSGDAGKRADLEAAASRLREAMRRVVAFETEGRQSRARREAAARLPLHLAALGVLLLGGASIAFSIVGRILHSDRHARSVGQHPVAMRLLFGWMAIVFLGLGLAGTIHNTMASAPVIYGGWILLVLGFILLAAVYPAFVLPSEINVCAPLQADPGHNKRLATARRARRKACCSLGGRFLNIGLGLYLCLLCVGMVAFRALWGLYPTDIKLLVSGLRGEELALIHSIQAFL